MDTHSARRDLRAALKARELTFGAWAQMGHPASAEILARSGFDWVCVDLEHGVIGLETAANLFRAVSAQGAVPVARLPLNDAIWIRRTLDAGARGLIIPMVNSAEEAERALCEAKYPPRGRRGYGYARANLYGIDFEADIRSANGQIPVIMQIEHRDAIANLEAILAVPGVDAVFIGPLDLSGSFGKTGDLECPEMVAALDHYRACCARAGVCAGIHLVRPDAAKVARAVEEGYRMIALGVDTVFLAAAAGQALSAARAV